MRLKKRRAQLKHALIMALFFIMLILLFNQIGLLGQSSNTSNNSNSGLLSQNFVIIMVGILILAGDLFLRGYYQKREHEHRIGMQKEELAFKQKNMTKKKFTVKSKRFGLINKR